MKKINFLNEQIIKRNLSYFEKGFSGSKDGGRKPFARYASFDYCFNYFQEFKNKKEIANEKNIQNSCLHVAFYLASWGMLRGSSFLLNKSIKYYEELIKYISKKESDFWKIDVQNYSDENIKKLIECSNDIEKILSNNGQYKVSDILITKIMLGIFGNVPAFDSYFKIGSGLNKFNKNALIEINIFYNTNNYKEIISKEARNTKTFEYNKSSKRKRKYTNTKIIDMIFFVEGYNKSKKS